MNLEHLMDQKVRKVSKKIELVNRRQKLKLAWQSWNNLSNKIMNNNIDLTHRINIHDPY